MTAGARLRLSDAEHAALRARLLLIAHFAADPDFAEYAADSIGLDIEAVRHERLAARLGLGLGQHLVEDDAGRVSIALHRPLLANSPPQQSPRGRPSDRALRLRLIKTIYACFPPGTATLTRGKRKGSAFEDLARFALVLAGERVADVHRQCLDAVRQIEAERA